MEKKIAHLTFIQDIIKRMGQNSFWLKGWSVTIVAALFALVSQGTNKFFILVVLFPLIMFWFLDGFFLYQEKLYRKLYEKVAENKISSDEFTLKINQVKNEVDSYYSVVFSKTLLPFYGIISIMVFVTFFCIMG